MYPSREDTKTTLSWIVWCIAILAIVLVVGAIIAFAAGWITLPFQKGSAGNVEAQFTKGYELYNSLKGTAQMVCNAQTAYDQAPESDKSQRQTQLIAVQSNYNRLAADYNAWTGNVFQGGVIRPADLPASAPSLKDMQTQVCPK